MKVNIKQFSVDMNVKTNGIEFEVRTTDNSKQIGDYYVTKKGVTWCKGKTVKANGISLTWDQVATLLASEGAKKAALAAAKEA